MPTTNSISFAPNESNEFYRDVKQRVADYFSATGKSRFADGLIIWKFALFGSGLIVSYTLILLQPWQSGFIYLLLALAFGVFALLFAINMAHDAAHDALVESKRLNHFIKWFSFALIGVDGNLWQMRHNKAHHIIPNVEGADSAVTKNPLVRLSPHQPVLRHHRFQHIYAPLLYGLIVLHSTFRQDFLYLFNRKQLIGLGRVTYSRRQIIEFILLKTTYLSLVLVIPLLATDFSVAEVLLGWFCMTYLVSWLFVWLLIGTHFCEEAEFPQVDDSGQLAHNWAYHAMVTSVDWSPHSRVAQFLLGGANAHATHHLFPNVSHTHYRFMSHIIEEEALAHGVPYNKITLGRMIVSHFRFLKRLGKESS
jgi:linoleoyl-CoA desaturase